MTKRKEASKKSDIDLLHIRVSGQLKTQMQELIDSGLFSNQAELVREGIRNVLLKYKKEKNKKDD